MAYRGRRRALAGVGYDICYVFVVNLCKRDPQERRIYFDEFDYLFATPSFLTAAGGLKDVTRYEQPLCVNCTTSIKDVSKKKLRRTRTHYWTILKNSSSNLGDNVPFVALVKLTRGGFTLLVCRKATRTAA